MPALNITILADSVKVTSTITQARFVTKAGAPASAAGRAYGVARTAGAVGDLVPVDVLGTSLVEAGAAVAVDAPVEADSSARAVTKSSGVTLGRALSAAAAAGDIIEVLLIPN
jgi:hypothetical protein